MMIYFLIVIVLFDSYCVQSFKHGNLTNELRGGTCAEFKSLNNFDKCCPERNDKCYMIHYDTKCYCDSFCSRSQDNTDCCPDAFDECGSLSNITGCIENHSYMDNCNKCTCVKGIYECGNFNCMINVDLMNEINSDAKNDWIAGNYSDFWGKKLEFGYVHKLGTILDKNSIKKYPKSFNYEYDDTSYDYRKYLNSIKPYRKFNIRNMEDCGSSWAFSTLDVASDRAAKHSHGLREQTPSVQHLLSCFERPKNLKMCSANTVEKAWSFIENRLLDNNTIKYGGVVDEKCFPFSSQDNIIEKCSIESLNLQKVKCKSTNKLTRVGLFKTTSKTFKKDSRKIKSIMKEIKDNGPVQMVFKVYSDFFMYKSGVYSRSSRAIIPNEKLAYHSVKVIGWNKTNDGTPYWIAANYWGPNWGENGYFRIRMNDTDTEIGKHVYAGYSTFN